MLSVGPHTVARELVRVLIEAEVEVVFGVPGVHNLALFEALDESTIRVIVVRHEASAAYAADAVGRLTGRPGIALTTSGPGAANTVAGMGEAQASRSPMVHITTTVARRHLGAVRSRGILHEHPMQREIFVPVTKQASHIDRPESAGPELLRVLSEATAAPQAPIYMQLPTDLLEDETEPVSEAEQPDPTTPIAGDLDEVARMMQAAERPAIWVGSGATDSGAALVTLAERLGAPVVLTHSAKRRWSASPHPLVLVHPPHEPSVTALLANSDAILVLGSDLDGMMTQEFRLPLGRIARIDTDADRARGEGPYKSEIAVTGDCAEVTRRLLEMVGERSGREVGAAAVAATEKSARLELEAESESQGGLRLLAALDSAIGERPAAVVCDMAVSGYWTGGYLPLRSRRRLLYPLGWGTLGFALPASIGAAALPGDGKTVAICGDGGVLFAIGELATLAQEGLDVTVLVHNDSCYGMLRYDAEERFGRSFAVDLEAPDFVALARSFGIHASSVDLADETLDQAIQEGLDIEGPSLVEIFGELSPPRVTSARFPLRRSPVNRAAAEAGDAR